jgi:hypothetical protein
MLCTRALTGPFSSHTSATAIETHATYRVSCLILSQCVNFQWRSDVTGQERPNYDVDAMCVSRSKATKLLRPIN